MSEIVRRLAALTAEPEYFHLHAYELLEGAEIPPTPRGRRALARALCRFLETHGPDIDDDPVSRFLMELPMRDALGPVVDSADRRPTVATVYVLVRILNHEADRRYHPTAARALRRVARSGTGLAELAQDQLWDLGLDEWVPERGGRGRWDTY